VNPGAARPKALFAFLGRWRSHVKGDARAMRADLFGGGGGGGAILRRLGSTKSTQPPPRRWPLHIVVPVLAGPVLVLGE